MVQYGTTIWYTIWYHYMVPKSIRKTAINMRTNKSYSWVGLLGQPSGLAAGRVGPGGRVTGVGAWNHFLGVFERFLVIFDDFWSFLTIFDDLLSFLTIFEGLTRFRHGAVSRT